MRRRTATRPEVRVGGFWLSSIVPQGWGELEHSTRLNGSWQASWVIPIVRNWRHPALVYGAGVEIFLGPVCVWSGRLEEPDWDGGSFVAIGASRDGETAMALDDDGNASTAPNTVIDAAIARGVLSWTRAGDFGTAPVGDADQTGVVTVQSVLDAWAQTNGSRWKVDRHRQLVIEPVDETDPKWFIVPGSGVLGSSAQERVDRVFVRFINSTTGRRDTASYPATSPEGGIESPVDLTTRGAMSAATAAAEAETIWNENQGRSGFTNGIRLARGQVTTKGGTLADLALIEAGDTAVLLGAPDPRGVAHNTAFVIGETEYSWEDDDVQVNPDQMSARDVNGVLEQVGNLAVDAMQAATARAVGQTQRGRVAVAALAVDATAVVHIDFPSAFTAMPNVTATAENARYTTAITNVTTTGFDLTTANWSAANGPGSFVQWIAEGA